MTSSLTTALTINNEQLRREVDLVKAENKAIKDEITQLRREDDLLKGDNTQLRANNDAMKDEITQLKDKRKDEIGQLTTLLDKMVVNNENQMQQINSQSNEIDIIRDENKQLRTEVQQLKVSQ